MHRIANKIFDKERALFRLEDAAVDSCIFDGPEDGESPLKECSDIAVLNTSFFLRYPLWHAHRFTLEKSYIDERARAALWYAEDGRISDCMLGGIKLLRESKNISLKNCAVRSTECGWRCSSLSFADVNAEGEYFLFESKDIKIDRLRYAGKYSFQYAENVEISDSILSTKDAFWHAKNVTVKNSILTGEYLGWYSEGLTLIGCTIMGTQPLCHCKRLKLVDCILFHTDFAFEGSEVEATVCGRIDSVKNPESGCIEADGFGEVIQEEGAALVRARDKH